MSPELGSELGPFPKHFNFLCGQRVRDFHSGHWGLRRWGGGGVFRVYMDMGVINRVQSFALGAVYAVRLANKVAWTGN